jgi:hypothetical protein
MKLIIKDSYDTFREMKKQVDTLIIGTAFGDDVDAKEDKDINPLQLNLANKLFVLQFALLY